LTMRSNATLLIAGPRWASCHAIQRSTSAAARRLGRDQPRAGGEVAHDGGRLPEDEVAVLENRDPPVGVAGEKRGGSRGTVQQIHRDVLERHADLVGHGGVPFGSWERTESL
jgi:hypothetical protein